VYDLTDHLSKFITFSNFGSLPSNIKIYSRDYSEFNKIALTEEVQFIEWHAVFSSDSNPCNMFDLFYSKVSSIVEKHIPLKQLSKRDLTFHGKPWITSAIKVSIRAKNSLFKYI